MQCIRGGYADYRTKLYYKLCQIHVVTHAIFRIRQKKYNDS